MPRWNMCLKVKVWDTSRPSSPPIWSGFVTIAWVAGRMKRKDNSDRTVIRLLEEQFSLPFLSGMLDGGQPKIRSVVQWQMLDEGMHERVRYMVTVMSMKSA